MTDYEMYCLWNENIKIIDLNKYWFKKYIKFINKKIFYKRDLLYFLILQPKVNKRNENCKIIYKIKN